MRGGHEKAVELLGCVVWSREAFLGQWGIFARAFSAPGDCDSTYPFVFCIGFRYRFSVSESLGPAIEVQGPKVDSRLIVAWARVRPGRKALDQAEVPCCTKFKVYLKVYGSSLVIV